MKYKITDETIQYFGKTLHRIEALRAFYNIKVGDKGGFIESENNLSQEGTCWVFDNAKVLGRAIISDDALVGGNAKVYDNAKVYGNALVYDDANLYGYSEVYGNAKVYGDVDVYGHAKVFDYAKVCGGALVRGDALVYDKAKVYGNAMICGDAKVSSDRDYIVFKNWWSSGRYFTWTRSNNRWSVGCFFGTGKQLIKKAYEDSEINGREYERIVKYVESIINEK